MADPAPTPTSLEGVTSLYRRFRPGRFVELRGQDHVVRALRGAVKANRVSHAYLFSGPRGTGKTTTARILAKALNCEHPVDGDACDECPSCVAITRGSSLDVIELDAASNNGVDDIREITAGAWHGTPGRWKVYIFDEVHQLSKAASAALLKTLEEPPQHVVFVLATTDPHKVLPTIRSRTQHLEFRLLAGETLRTLLDDVQGAAKLSADDATLDAAVRMGRGSARDALSALDQLLATGSVNQAQPQFDDLLGSLVGGDATAALMALAVLTNDGWDPEQLAESFVAEVRQIFLLQVAPDVADAVDVDRERLSEWGTKLGLARTVRVLETVGRAIREMKSAPEKIVMLEVAMVRLVRPELDVSVEALDERLTRIERAGVPAPSPSAPPVTPPPTRPIGATVASVRHDEPVHSAPVPATAKVDAAAPSRTLTSSEGSSVEFGLDDLRRRFVERVIPRTSRSAQLLLKSAVIVAVEGSRLKIAIATEEMRQNTELIAQGLRSAMDHEFKVAYSIDWVVDSNIAGAAAVPVTSPPRQVRSRPDEPEDQSHEADQEFDHDPTMVVDSVADHLITQAFPGAQEIT